MLKQVLRSIGIAVATLLIPVTVFAFTGQSGFASVSYTGAASQDKVASTVFTAPANISCMVTVDTQPSTQAVSTNPTGFLAMWPLAQINGSNLYTGPAGGYATRTTVNGIFRTSASRVFTVSANQTVRFGCHIDATGDFAQPGTTGSCKVSYLCIIPQ